MEALTYRLDRFEGPLDLLLTLIHNNKVSITDIPISLICDQYLEALKNAEKMDMDIASEFIVMASELMLIKSRMLLPRAEEEEEDPRMQLTDALLRYQQAKEAVALLSPLYARFSARTVKDTDEIGVDKTFVADQDPENLALAMRRVVAYNEAMKDAREHTFTPMISKPIVPVEWKIVRILSEMVTRKIATMKDLLRTEKTLPDLIAGFLGVLELVKLRRILVSEPEDDDNAVLGPETRFFLNEDPTTYEEEIKTEADNGTE